MNKRINVDVDFKSNIDRLFQELDSKQKDFGRDTNFSSSGASNKERYSYEKQAYQRFEKEYDVKGAQDRIKKGTSNPFDSADSRLLETSERMRAALEELDDSLRLSNLDQSRRHNEWASLTQKEIDTELSVLNNEKKRLQKGGQNTGDIDKDIRYLDSLKKSKSGGNDEELGKKIDRLNSQYGITSTLDRLSRTVGEAVGPTTGRVVSTGLDSLATGYNVSQSGGGFMGGALAGAGSMILGTAGMFLDKGKEFEKSYNQLNKITNVGGGNFGAKQEYNAEVLGIDRSEFNNVALELARSRGGGGKGLEKETMRSLQLQQGLGLGTSEFNNLAKGERYGDKNSTFETIATVTSFLESKGLVNTNNNGFDTVNLGKYLAKIADLNQKQLDLTGEISSGRSVKALSAFVGLGGIFSKEENAMRVMNGLGDTFANPVDQLQEYRNTQAILKNNPNLQGDAFGVMEKSQNAIFDPEILRTRLQDVFARNGVNSKEDFDKLSTNQQSDLRFSVASLTKTTNNLSLARKFTDQYLVNPEDALKEENIKNTLSPDKLQRLGKNNTGKFESMEVTLANEMKVMGDTLGDFTVKAIHMAGEGIKVAQDVGDKITGAIDKLTSVFSKPIKTEVVTIKNTVAGRGGKH